MKLKHLILATSLAFLSLSAGAATLIIPASGTGPGAGNSHWQTEVTLHNTAAKALSVTLRFHDSAGASQGFPVTIPARRTLTLDDVVHNGFGRDAATGAIVVDIADADASRLTVTSRTFNLSPQGEFGQDIPALAIDEASVAGDLTVLPGPARATAARFNFGLYAIDAVTVRWNLIRADGSLGATKDVSYLAGTQTQYGTGISTLFGATAQDNDVVHAELTGGKAMFYGSAINQITGDPSYVSGVRARGEIRIDFVGVDVDEDGTVDIADADNDGILDAPLEVGTSRGFPNFFRVVARGENGEAVRFEIVQPLVDILLVDDQGTISYAPGANLIGTNGSIQLRATAGSNVSVLTIPLRYR